MLVLGRVITLVGTIPGKRRKPKLSLIKRASFFLPGILHTQRLLRFVSEPHGWKNRREAPFKRYTSFEVIRDDNQAISDIIHDDGLLLSPFEMIVKGSWNT